MKAPVVRGEQEVSVQVRVDAYRAQGCNVIVPFEIANDRIDPYHAFRLAVVKVNPDPDMGDVWSPGSKKVNGSWVKTLALTRPALQKIGMAAGVVWDPNHTKRTDNNQDKDYVEFKAVGLFRGPDGQWRTIQGTKEIDLRVIEEEIRENQREKMSKKDFKVPDKQSHLRDKPEAEILEGLVLKELTQWRKHKVARCETGAMLRALRSLGLKNQYLPGEIAQPFVFARVDLRPDYSLSEVREVTRKAAAADISDLYGGPPTVRGIQISQEEAQIAQAKLANGETAELLYEGRRIQYDSEEEEESAEADRKADLIAATKKDKSAEIPPDDPAAERKAEEQQTIGDLTETQKKQFEVGDLFTARAEFKRIAPDGSGEMAFFEVLASFMANKIDELQVSSIGNVKARLRKEYDDLKKRLEESANAERKQGGLGV